MVLGKILGATSIGAVQGAVFLPLIPFLDIPVDWARFPEMALIVLTMAFGLTSLGFFFAWWLNSVQGFHAVMNVLLMPMWLLSGALFPPEGASPWMGYIMAANPLTYAVTGLRRLLFSGQEIAGPSMTLCWIVTGAFAVVAFGLAAYRASKPSAENLS
jgi:ABC-type polysaccharide/polyol phosphate export permease